MHLLRQVVANTHIRTQFGRFVRGFVSTTTTNSQAAAAEPLTEPAPDGTETPPNPKLVAIVDNIAKLNLLEVSELSALLKKTLNLPDAPVAAYGANFGVQQPQSNEDEEAAQGPAVVQTAFKVKIMSFDDSKKIALIKELKNQIEGMNLVQAKKFIESLPQFIKEDVSKEEAEQLKTALEQFGAVVEIS